jgi:hypothetical protein
MNTFAQLALWIWFPIVLLLFKFLPVRKAIIVSFIVSIQFLPVSAIIIPLFPDYDKISSTSFALIVGIILFDVNRIKAFRLSWFDAPIIIRCISPMFSSLSNGLGLYDGISAALNPLITWGIPYFCARLYLGSLSGLKDLAIAIFIGGLSYVPLCLYESRMSPQLHRMFYGFHAHPSFSQVYRYGGYRPVVFMDHGLMTALWIVVAALIGFWLWKTGVIKKVFNIPTGFLVAILMMTVINNRSTGAWILCIVGIIILLWAKWFRNAFIQKFLIGFSIVYMVLSSVHLFPSDSVVSVISDVFSPERAQSLAFRLDNEELLAERALQKFWFGWGGWGRNRVSDVYGEDLSTTDSMWIISFGSHGVVGVASLMATLLLPTILFIRCFPPRTWTHKKIAPAAVLAVCLNIFVFDSLLNSFYSPVYVLICGGLTGLALKEMEMAKRIEPSLQVSNHYLNQQTRLLEHRQDYRNY